MKYRHNKKPDIRTNTRIIPQARNDELPLFLLVILLVFCISVFVSALAPRQAFADEENETEESDTGSLRRSDRMEFDARLVRGQKATSGAVYLFQRSPRPLPPLVVLEQSYLDRIVEPVLGNDETRQEAD